MLADRSTQVVTRMPADKPDLIVDSGDLPATARELRDVFAASGRFFDRGVPVKIAPDSHGGPPSAVELTPTGIVIAAHELCRPVKEKGHGLEPVTLPGPVARLYLEMAGEWDLPPLAGITTAPVRGRIIGLKGAVPGIGPPRIAHQGAFVGLAGVEPTCVTCVTLVMG